MEKQIEPLSIEEIEKEIISELEMLGDDWMDKYEHLIQMGKDLPNMSIENKTKDKLIKGCQSQVWLHSTIKEGKVLFEADSDAPIPKGTVALMVRVLSGHSPKEIINAKLEFLDTIGLRKNLSPNRANGLNAIIKQMKLDAVSLINHSRSSC